MLTSNHIVSSYEEELQEISSSVVELGGIVEVALTESVNALINGDNRLANRVIETDKRADHLFYKIEESAIFMIARRQPVAQDLRTIMSAIRMGNDLERVGDLAKNIAKRAKAIDEDVGSRSLIHGMERMTQMVARQLHSALDAYAHDDALAARTVWNKDDEIDAMYTSLFREMLTYMMENPRNISPCTHLLFCAKNIERIGDHATNLAETIYYKVTGEHLDGDRPKSDNTIVPVSD